MRRRRCRWRGGAGRWPRRRRGAMTTPSATETRDNGVQVFGDARPAVLLGLLVDAARGRCWRPRPAAKPAKSASSSTVVMSGTRPMTSSAMPVTAIARASSRRRERVGSTFAAPRIPSAVPPVRARTSRPKATGPPPRSLACSTADGRRRRRSPRRRRRRRARAAAPRPYGPCRRRRPGPGGAAQSFERGTRAGRVAVGQFQEVQDGDGRGEQSGRDIRAESRLVQRRTTRCPCRAGC